MSEVLLLAMAISAAIGLLHAVYVYRLEIQDAESGRRIFSVARAGYYAFWTFVLWLLLGSYALSFWLLSVLVYALYRAAKFIAHPGTSPRESTIDFPGNESTPEDTAKGM